LTLNATAESIRALYALKSRFDSLEALIEEKDLERRKTRPEARLLLHSIREELRASRSELGPKTYQELASHLVVVEAKLEGSIPRPATTSRTIRIARSSGHDSERSHGEAGAAPSPPAAPASQAAAPLRPLPVHASDSCPPGTELESRAEDGVEEEWCRQLPALGGLRDGWYVRYFEGGRPQQIGEYRDGLRIGVWTRFFPSGAARAQAQFERRMQQGWLLSFDESGTRQKAVRFEMGTAVRDQ
jgi:hypothetical protein